MYLELDNQTRIVTGNGLTMVVLKINSWKYKKQEAECKIDIIFEKCPT